MTDHVVLRLSDGAPPPPAELRLLLGRPLDHEVVDGASDGDHPLRLCGYLAVPAGTSTCVRGETADVLELRPG
ncbi:MAG: hypothetical protein ACLGIV_01700 [Actinomycetes bacterium]